MKSEWLCISQRCYTRWLHHGMWNAGKRCRQIVSKYKPHLKTFWNDEVALRHEDNASGIVPGRLAQNCQLQGILQEQETVTDSAISPTTGYYWNVNRRNVYMVTYKTLMTIWQFLSQQMSLLVRVIEEVWEWEKQLRGNGYNEVLFWRLLKAYLLISLCCFSYQYSSQQFKQ